MKNSGRDSSRTLKERDLRGSTGHLGWAYRHQKAAKPPSSVHLADVSGALYQAVLGIFLRKHQKEVVEGAEEAYEVNKTESPMTECQG